MNENAIYTIGHSTHEIGAFVAMLKKHDVDAVADVRSVPYSRRQPQFNRDELADALKPRGVAYVFVGKELGARSDDPGCYREGRVSYRALAGTSLFRSGVERIRDGSQRMRVALMCAEKDPLDCHRAILVGRELVETGSSVKHILADGSVESHSVAMKRLFKRLKMPDGDMFLTKKQLEDQVYAAQEKRIAFVDEGLARGPHGVKQ